MQINSTSKLIEQPTMCKGIIGFYQYNGTKGLFSFSPPSNKVNHDFLIAHGSPNKALMALGSKQPFGLARCLVDVYFSTHPPLYAPLSGWALL